MSLTEDDKQWIVTQLGAVETGLDTRLEVLGTRLLRAFHDWASPVDMPARTHAAVLRALDIEVESLGNRVWKIEPPH